MSSDPATSSTSEAASTTSTPARSTPPPRGEEPTSQNDERNRNGSSHPASPCRPLTRYALAARPALLVADEAMAGLASAEVDEILAILLKLNQEGVAVIMIEHIMRAVMRFSERVVVLDAGRKIAEGTPQEVIADPAVERAYLGE